MTRKIKLGWNQDKSEACERSPRSFHYKAYEIYWKRVDGHKRIYIKTPSNREYYASSDVSLENVIQCIDGKFNIHWMSEERKQRIRMDTFQYADPYNRNTYTIV